MFNSLTSESFNALSSTSHVLLSQILPFPSWFIWSLPLSFLFLYRLYHVAYTVTNLSGKSWSLGFCDHMTQKISTLPQSNHLFLISYYFGLQMVNFSHSFLMIRCVFVPEDVTERSLRERLNSLYSGMWLPKSFLPWEGYLLSKETSLSLWVPSHTLPLLQIFASPCPILPVPYTHLEDSCWYLLFVTTHSDCRWDLISVPNGHWLISRSFKQNVLGLANKGIGQSGATI